MRPKNRATRLMTDIAGFKDASLRHLPAQFILRWWTADWFQPIAKVGRTGNDEWPLISADGDTAPPSGRDTSGKEIPRHFYEDPSCKDRLAEFNRGPAENDPSRPRVTAGAVLIIALLLPVCADVGSA
ncbi:MAG: hypothetical protein WAM72_24350 [Xanthobacteraceae bacterium]|jgi:hypothetical protein